MIDEPKVAVSFESSLFSKGQRESPLRISCWARSGRSLPRSPVIPCRA